MAISTYHCRNYLRGLVSDVFEPLGEGIYFQKDIVLSLQVLPEHNFSKIIFISFYDHFR